MKKKILLAAGVGFLMGIMMTGIGIFTVMPSLMLVTHEAAQGYDETITLLSEHIEQSGWNISSVIEMNKSLAKHGVDFQPRVTLLKICHPDYARSILTTNRDVSVMMPCTFSIWENNDGKVYISGMNTGLMGKMFGGNVAHVMGGKVSRDEKQMLADLIKE